MAPWTLDQLMQDFGTGRVDILDATTRMVEKKAIKYPMATARGKALKYNHLADHDDHDH